MTEPSILQEEIKDLVTAIGYRAELLGDSAIKTSLNGVTGYIHPYEDGSIQLVVGWKEPPATFGLDDVNTFNSTYRFGTVFLDDESIVLQSNFLFEADSENARPVLEGALGIFEGLIGELLRAMRNELLEEEQEAE